MTRVRVVMALLVLGLLPASPWLALHSLERTEPISRATITSPAHAGLPITVHVATPRATARASRSISRPPAAPSVTIAARTGAEPPVSVPSERPTPNIPRPDVGAPVHDVTQYCWTGDRNAAGYWPRIGDVAVLDRSIPFGTVVHIDGLGDYVVRDWIGHGSEFDIYAGRGPACEHRALTFGRKHLAVEVQR